MAMADLATWLDTPPGRYLQAWEQTQLDQAVADRFGFHALQLGLPQIDALQANRMPHRWLASDVAGAVPAGGERVAGRRVVLRCEFGALPFPNHSLDLVVLPHTLELAGDPHQTLREVERVLVPEGRIVLLGFNPASLWGLRQRMGLMRQHMGHSRSTFLPPTTDFIGYWRLRDWLRLLGFEVEGGRFGGYRPPFGSQRWLDRFGWMEASGERWWPVLGAAYFVVAVKRVRGMRLVGWARKDNLKAKPAPPVVAHRQPTIEAAEFHDID
jgi:SAM-dependent methyltransferase